MLLCVVCGCLYDVFYAVLDAVLFYFWSLLSQELNLGANYLKHLIPEIGSLKILTHLELNDNVLEDIPTETAQLTSLQVLNLEGCVVWCLFSSPHLTIHTGNQLKVLPDEIGKMQELKKLLLGYNRLIEMTPEIGTLHWQLHGIL